VTSRKDIETISKVRIKQQDLGAAITPEGTYDFRYRIVTEDGIAVSGWTPIISVSAPTITLNNADTKFAAIENHEFSLSTIKKYEFPAYDIFVYFVPEINFAIGNPFYNTVRVKPNGTHAIYTTPVPHFLKTNMRIAVAGVGANFNTTNALVVAANEISFTITGGMNTTVAATPANTTAGTVNVISSNVGNTTVQNSEYFFFDRFYDRPGSTTFNTTFTFNNVYAFKTSANVTTDIVVDPAGSTANALTNLISSGKVVKYTASNNCMFTLLQPATVPSKSNLKPDVIDSPNLIISKKQIP
jgi:hypothetical protein